jgi:hypothetical protein
MAAKKDRPAPSRTPAKPAAGKPKSETFSAHARAEVSPGELRRLIEEAAYYRAKQRGFAPGHEVDDWVQAEAEVLRRIEGRPSS